MTDTSSSRGRLLQNLLILTVVALVVITWRQRSELKRMRAEPSPAVAAQQPTQATPDVVNETGNVVSQSDVTAASSPAVTNNIPQVSPPSAPVVELEMTPTGMAPKPRTSGLVLADTPVVPIDGGLRAVMKFNATTPEPLGIIDIVVRLPRGGEAKILGLDPEGSAHYGMVAQRVSEDGKFAIFHGQLLEGGQSVAFALSVSGEATADVRGTAGIGPFDLIISPSGASTRPKL